MTGDVTGQDKIVGNKEQCSIEAGQDYLGRIENADVKTERRSQEEKK